MLETQKPVSAQRDKRVATIADVPCKECSTCGRVLYNRAVEQTMRALLVSALIEFDSSLRTWSDDLVGQVSFSR